jgi:hypothetical protein
VVGEGRWCFRDENYIRELGLAGNVRIGVSEELRVFPFNIEKLWAPHPSGAVCAKSGKPHKPSNFQSKML